MRTQYCRQHIKKTAQECDLGDDIVSEVERVDKFCSSNPAFADCATRPIYRLITEKDEEVRNKAISLAEKSLKEETPTGGIVRTRLTEPEIIIFIRKARRELRGESGEEKKVEKKPTDPTAIINAIEDEALRAKVAAYRESCLSRGERVYANDIRDYIKMAEISPASLGDRVRAAEIAAAAANQPAPPAPIAAELPPPLPETATIAERLKRDEAVLKANGFCPASEFDPATGGRLIRTIPYKVIPVQLTKEQAEAAITSVVRGYLTKAQQGIWEEIRKTGELGDADLEIFEGLIDGAGERVP